MSIEAFTKLIPEYDGYSDEAIIRIECSVRELRALENSKPIAWMNPNAPEGVFARHEEGARNFGCTVPLYAAPTTQPERVSVPRELLDRAVSALQRHLDRHGAMRIPVDMTDSDVVQTELKKLLAAAQEGK